MSALAGPSLPPATVTQTALADLLAHERRQPQPSAAQCEALRHDIEARRFGSLQGGRLQLAASAAAVQAAVSAGRAVFTAELTGYCGWKLLMAHDSRQGMQKTLEGLAKPLMFAMRSGSTPATTSATSPPIDATTASNQLHAPVAGGVPWSLFWLLLLAGGGVAVGLATLLGRRSGVAELPAWGLPGVADTACEELHRAQAQREALSREVREHVAALQAQISRLQAQRQ